MKTLMRRKEREVSDLKDCIAILNKCDVLRIALCTNNKPYIVPMNFGFTLVEEQLTLYLHCAPKGKKLDIIALNNAVCFEADCAFETIKGAIACKWSAHYASVIGEGTITSVHDEQQKQQALNTLMQRYGFIGTPEYTPQNLRTVHVLQIAVTTISGKQTQA